MARDRTPASATPARYRGLSPEVLKASLGAMLVFYNVTVIAYALPFVGKALFTTPDRVQAALNVLGIVAAGYLAKPVAQAVAGWYADRHGRKPVLVAASLLAALMSLLLAVIPDHDTIGVAAPILFSVAVALQAAIAGSEWPMLAAYVAESTAPEQRGFLTSFASFNVCLGWLLAILVPLALHSLLRDQQYADWGWRISFLPAVALGVLSFMLRRTLPESPAFTALQASGRLSPSPLAELVHQRALTWLIVMVQVGAISATFFLTVSYSVVFVALADKFTAVEALWVGTIGLIVLVAGICAGGILADRLGPRPVSATGYILIALLAYPAYALLSHGSLAAAMAGVVMLAAPLALSAGVYEAWTVSSFPTRYTGIALTANGVAIAIFGTPCLWLASLLARDHGYLAPAILLVAAGVLGAATAYMLTPSINEPLA